MIAHFRSYAQHRGQPTWSPCPKDMVRAALPGKIWDHLEKHVNTETYEYLSDWARENIAKGRAEGRAEAQAEGKAEAMAEAVVIILDARNIQVPDELKDKILVCRDFDRLNAWIAAAATIESSDALLDEEL